ncbi:MAG TPA: hypothetical protein VMF89_28905, partial [Polyangiales bacterium]|nr:hypothetical protein [Polyangiales bacterium]
MRVVLSELSSFSGRIELPAKEQRTPYLDVAQAVRLSGELRQQPEHVELRGAGAELLELKSALLVFGKVAVQAAARLAMRHVTAAFKSDGALALRIQAELGECAELRLEVGDTAVAGAVTLQGLAVAQEDNAGSFVAASLRIDELTVTWGDIALRAPQLVVDGLRVGWGAPAFELGAARVRADAAELLFEGVSARVSSFECEGLLVRDGAVEVASLSASSIEGDVMRPAARRESGQHPEQAAQPHTTRSRIPFADLRLLDGLMGRLNADVHVDATVAIVRRRALHKLRAQVQEGSIDFRALEHGLSALEDSLLD